MIVLQHFEKKEWNKPTNLNTLIVIKNAFNGLV